MCGFVHYLLPVYYELANALVTKRPCYQTPLLPNAVHHRANTTRSYMFFLLFCPYQKLSLIYAINLNMVNVMYRAFFLCKVRHVGEICWLWILSYSRAQQSNKYPSRTAAPLKMKGLQCRKTWDIGHQTVRRHIPRDLNCQEQYCDKPKRRKGKTTEHTNLYSANIGRSSVTCLPF